MLLRDILMGLRILELTLSFPLVFASAAGFILFGRGQQTLCNGVRSMAFLSGVSAGGFQALYLFFGTPGMTASPATILIHTLNTCYLVVAILLVERLRNPAWVQVDMILRHLDVASAIVALDRVDRTQAQIVAADCRVRTARTLVEKSLG